MNFTITQDKSGTGKVWEERVRWKVLRVKEMKW